MNADHESLSGGLSCANPAGICPQFDILWPELTAREHLQLYAAIRGVPSDDRARVAEEAAAEVGLTDKLDAAAGELSGGQVRV